MSTLLDIFRTFRDIAENRIDLFALEWQEQRLRLMDLLLLLLIGSVCGAMALFLITLAIVAAFWNSHPVLVLGLLTLVYALIAVTAFGMLRSRLRRLGIFAATLEQLKKDLACFKEES